MKTEQIIILVVAFFLGMLLLNMVKNVCGCGEEGFQNYYSGTTRTPGVRLQESGMLPKATLCGSQIRRQCGLDNDFYCGNEFNCPNNTTIGPNNGLPLVCSNKLGFGQGSTGWNEWKSGVGCPAPQTLNDRDDLIFYNDLIESDPTIQFASDLLTDIMSLLSPPPAPLLDSLTTIKNNAHLGVGKAYGYSSDQTNGECRPIDPTMSEADFATNVSTQPNFQFCWTRTNVCNN